MYFNSNIKFLRNRKDITQDVAAIGLGMSRSTLNSYENGSVKNPSLDALLTFSKYYKISIDTLVRIDMTKLSRYQMSELEKGRDVFLTGSKLRVIATTVDSRNRENIEVVPLKAKAGYTNGYADPDFIKKLPVFQLPILFNDRKYRMFQISGDSMLPIPDKSWVIGEYVESFYDIKDNHPYIVLTQDEGIVFKIAFNNLKKKKTLLLKSLNMEYQPYEVRITEVKEVWKFCNYISSEIPEMKNELISKIERIEKEMKEIKDMAQTA
jgi:transcriptional regulator with XRE-family HTH domain